MVRSILFFSIISILVLLFTGCASMQGDSQVGYYQDSTNLGKAMVNDIVENVPNILQGKFLYNVSTIRVTGNLIYYETEWNYRNPFHDEMEEGADQARTKFIVEANPRGRAISGTGQRQSARIRLSVQNAVLIEGEGWVGIPAGEGLNQHVDSVKSELRHALDINFGL